jgi:hypothetical protein
MVSMSDTIRAVSNDKSLVLFNTIALASGNTDLLITKLGVTRKQYYSRMAALIDAGLITRRNGKYLLTSFGKVVYAAQVSIGKAIQDFWKLAAIDSIGSSGHGLTAEERGRIINTLITDKDVKEILLGHNRTRDAEQDTSPPLIVPQLYSDTKTHS